VEAGAEAVSDGAKSDKVVATQDTPVNTLPLPHHRLARGNRER